MKILVMFTGGTIGSCRTDTAISLQKDTQYLLLERYHSVSVREIWFDTECPYFVLSENVSAGELTTLVTCVQQNAKKDYDGIIVTHGTDTLQYSAAALHYALGTDSIPVVLVSGNFPLEDPRSNGLSNFSAAVSFIKSGIGRGVFAAYHNMGKKAVDIHRGIKLLRHKEGDDALFSADDLVYATVSEETVTKNSLYPQEPVAAPLFDLTFAEESGVLVVKVCPGNSYRYDLSAYKAVLLLPYHSSTLSTANQNFCDFCHRAAQAHLPVYVLHLRRDTVYESAIKYEELGIIPLPDSTFAAAYVKLWLENSRT